MQLVRATLIEKIKRSSSVESFRLMPHERIAFVPGQFLQVLFDERNPGNKELNKYLSMSSSPTKDYIEVTKKLSESTFSEKLRALKAGDEISLKAPFGNCVLKDDYKKIGFLIGGIGITPVISILEYIADTHLAIDALLFYSNQTEEDIAFKKELDVWQSANANIRVVYTVTACEPRDKKCIRGRIDKDLFARTVTDVEQRVFYIFGSSGMVEAMRNICIESKCAKENIKTESFIGYY